MRAKQRPPSRCPAQPPPRACFSTSNPQQAACGDPASCEPCLPSHDSPSNAEDIRTSGGVGEAKRAVVPTFKGEVSCGRGHNIDPYFLVRYPGTGKGSFRKASDPFATVPMVFAATNIHPETNKLPHELLHDLLTPYPVTAPFSKSPEMTGCISTPFLQ